MTVALWPALRRIGFRWQPAVRLAPRDRPPARAPGAVGRRLRGGEPARVLRDHQPERPRRHAARYTAYSQAFIFFSLPHAIVAVSIFTALLPGMAERWWRRRSGRRPRALLARAPRHEIAMIPAAAGLRGPRGPDRRRCSPAYGHVTVRRPRAAGAHARGVRRGPAVLLRVPAADPHLLRDARQPDAGAREHRRGRREPRRPTCVLAFGLGWGVPGTGAGPRRLLRGRAPSCSSVILRGRLGGRRRTPDRGGPSSGRPAAAIVAARGGRGRGAALVGAVARRRPSRRPARAGRPPASRRGCLSS